MKIFDKGRSLSKEICDLCKNEIKPGEKMLISIIIPSHERQLFNRLYGGAFHGYIDDAPKYHEKCYLSQLDKRRKKGS